jgi:hypothetical protein
MPASPDDSDTDDSDDEQKQNGVIPQQYHKYTYFDSNNQPCESGLVAWKDTNMVYMLTNNSSTVDSSLCSRMTMFGEISINWPNVISEYNKYMGGVDLADKRRLHCNSTIMGQNRWWLKLFFYNLDVATANALVLYRLATGNKNMNIVQFKLQLLMGWQGTKLQPVLPSITQVEHKSDRLPEDHRFSCVYCALFFQKKSRTRFFCTAECCQLPLCRVDPKKNKEDCFSMCHANEDILKACQLKYQVMVKSVTDTNKRKQSTTPTSKGKRKKGKKSK